MIDYGRFKMITEKEKKKKKKKRNPGKNEEARGLLRYKLVVYSFPRFVINSGTINTNLGKTQAWNELWKIGSSSFRYVNVRKLDIKRLLMMLVIRMKEIFFSNVKRVS